MERLAAMASLCLLVLLCGINGVLGAYIKYKNAAGPVEGKLNIHLVPHSHDDVGWLKTIDQYYVGSNNSIQGASVKNTLDSVVVSLLKDPNRKFVFAEQAFFQRWWEEQSPETQMKVRKLVDSGQLEFVNGGWCMHDEAATHYIDMIDQTTLGHRMIKKQFNKVPRAGWQIDPFGHSAVQAYLLGAELGFDSLHFARIDYQDRAKRKADKSLEVIWRGSKTFGPSAEIFTNVFPVHYSAPSTFGFEVNDDTDCIPVQDDLRLLDFNVQERINDFINVSKTQANVTLTNHIMWTMGDDFRYQYAESWFKNMDKLIHYVNKDGRVNAFYSTPSMYADAKHAANETWPLKTEDFFPYADSPNAYWTGYFTSRPSFKGYVRFLSSYYLAARQLEFFAGRTPSGPYTSPLGDALGIAQHHDGVSGTAKQHTTNDYSKRLALGASEAEKTVNMAMAYITDSNSSKQSMKPEVQFSQCNLLNISYCPPTEKEIPEGKSLVVVAYNPLGQIQTNVIRIPVNHDDLVVKDSNSNTVEVQYVEVDDITSNLRSFYTEAYLGLSSEKAPKYWLVFQASVPPLGWSTYFISKAGGEGKGGKRSVADTLHNDTVVVGPGDLKMYFSVSSGQLKRMVNHKTGIQLPIQQSYLWYSSSTGDQDPQASGAYIFRPNDSPPVAAAISIPLNIMRGPVVDEVYQKFNPWIYQVTRLYKDTNHAEVEFTIGPIPTDDGVGKEVITRMTANMATNKTFYTDSNGRDFIKRVRDYREDWPLDVHQPVAGNYYPINLGIFMADEKSEFSVLVDRAVGGASIQDGELEMMLHRRILKEDFRGVGEALDETVCASSTCEGLTIRGKYYISVDKKGTGARWRRSFGQQIYSPLVLGFTHEELDDGSVLLRLAHLYEADEDAQYSNMATVELKKIFASRRIKEVKETTLSANQDKTSMKTLKWRVEGDQGVTSNPLRGAPLIVTSLIVELGPMEIRTFVIRFR
ncbi:alpha-mannosidase isoform X2 [Aristolochia californica]|uniref:alpha-mannosidase isoform X2 n=1 Tax=Aristolochia californica TaxID=171875 RepID=UPI0035D9EDF4